MAHIHERTTLTREELIQRVQNHDESLHEVFRIQTALALPLV